MADLESNHHLHGLVDMGRYVYSTTPTVASFSLSKTLSVLLVDPYEIDYWFDAYFLFYFPLHNPTPHSFVKCF